MTRLEHDSDETPTPAVGVVMGSDSDWPVMQDAVDTLRSFDVACEARVLSAHRTPDDAKAYAESAQQRGLRLLIGGAGGAAHLPGVLAAATPLPIIGVPIPNGPLNGADALLAIVQMPRGIPVATVGIGRADNAALLAIQILALADQALAQRLVDYRHDMAEKVRAADRRLRGAQ